MKEFSIREVEPLKTARSRVIGGAAPRKKGPNILAISVNAWARVKPSLARPYLQCHFPQRRSF